MKQTKGITLIALIITIVVLLILAVVAIRAVQGDGIIRHAQNAKSSYEQAQVNEQLTLEQMLGQLNEENSYSEDKKVNAPLLKTGMTPVKYDTANSCWVVTTSDDTEWYDYTNKKWANVMLQDGLEYDSNGKVTSEGSMFVWIPRFAYKITSLPTYSDATINGYNRTATSGAGTIDVKFLQGKGDSYDGGTAVRTNTSTQNYVVHPSFTNNVDLGGWDSELTGYWVAKFEAAYAGEVGKPNTAQDSNVKYTYTIGINVATNSKETLTNNYYGSQQLAVGKNIKYPTFIGNKSGFNFISVSDAYTLCQALNDNDNPYGINTNSDTHLMKNSEWGAIAYLSRSNYGKNSEVAINSESSDTAGVVPENYVWTTTGNGNYKSNVSQSTTGNVYGIYDLNGGLWERVASYVNNNSQTITDCGASLKVTKSTKYITVYPKGTNDTLLTNYIAAKSFYGDAVIETASLNEDINESTTANVEYNRFASWFNDYSSYPRTSSPFFSRGGGCWGQDRSGLFAYEISDGTCDRGNGFRAVLV